MKKRIWVWLLFVFILLITFPRFQSVVTAQNDSPDALLAQGISLLEAGEAEAALVPLQAAADGFAAAKNDVMFAEAYFQLGLARYAMEDYYEARAHFDTAWEIYRNKVKDDRAYARVAHQYARAQEKLGQGDNALSLYRQALKKAEAVNDVPELASIHLHMGDFYFSDKKYSDAVDEYTEATNLFFQVPDDLGQAQTLFKLAETHLFLWNLDLARQNYTDASLIFQRLGRLADEAQSYYQIAYTYHHVDDFYTAVPIYETALSLFQQAQDKIGEARTQAALGDLFHHIGFLAKAHEYLNTALEGARANRDTIGEGMTLNYLGDLALTQNNPSEALTLYRQVSPDASLDIYIQNLHGLARVALMQGIYTQARDLINTALEESRNGLKDPYNERRVFLTFAWIEYLGGKSGETTRYLNNAREVAKRVGDQRGEALALLEMARYQIYLLSHNRAADLYQQALSIAESMGDALFVGQIYLKAGDLKEFFLDYEGAMGDYSAAATVFQSMTDPLLLQHQDVLVAATLSRQAYIFYLRGHYEDAVTTATAGLDMISALSPEDRDTSLILQVKGFSHFVLGRVYLDLALWEESGREFSMAETLFTELNDSGYLALVFGFEGHLAYHRGDNTTAGSAYTRAGSLISSIDRQPNPGREPIYYRARGIWLIGQANLVTSKLARVNEPSEADLLNMQTTYGEVITHFRSFGDPRGKREAYTALAELYLVRNTLNEADKWASNALSEARNSGDDFSQGLALLVQAQIFIRRNNDSRIVTTFEQAIAKFTDANVPSKLALAYEQLGDYYLKHAQLNEAIEAFSQMRQVAESQGDFVQVAAAETYMAQAYESQRRFDLALVSYENAEEALGTTSRYRFLNTWLETRQKIITYAAWTLYDLNELNLEQISHARSHWERVQNALRAATTANSDKAFALALVAEGELLLVADRDPVQARQKFSAARDMALQLIFSDDLVAQAWLGIARSYTSEALTVARVSGDSGELANGSPEALAYDAALNTSRSNPLQEQAAYLAFGNAYMQRNIFVSDVFSYDAKRLFRAAADKAKGFKDWVGNGYALLALGDMYLLMGDTENARKNFDEARKSFVKVDDYIGQGETLGRLGRMELREARFDLALENYTNMLNLYLYEEDQVRAAYTQMLIGEVALVQKQYPLAESSYKAALSTIRAYRLKTPDVSTQSLADRYEIDVLLNLSQLYIDLAQYQQASVVITEAKVISERIGNPFIQALVSHREGQWMAISENDPEKVKAVFQGVIEIYEKYGDTRRLIEAYLDLGGAYYSIATQDVAKGTINQPEILKALETYGNGLRIARSLNEPSLIALSQYHYGLAAIASGRTSQGEGQLEQALLNATLAGDTTLQAAIDTALGLRNEQNALLNQNQAALAQAVLDYEQAIPLIENIHFDIRTETGQTDFFIQNLKPYHRLVNLLALSQPELALNYAERGRSRTFLFQFLSEQIQFSDDNSDAYNTWQQLRIQRQELRGSDDLKRIEQVDRDLIEAENQLVAQNQIFRQITRVEASSLTDIQASLKPGTAMLVYYIVPAEPGIDNGGIFVFVLKHDTFEVVKLDIELSTLMTALDVVRSTSKNKTDNAESSEDTPSQLYDALILPVATYLSGVERLILVPHGDLNYLSFALLQSPDGRPLSALYTLVYSPSASYYEISASQESPVNDLSNVLLVGNPTSSSAQIGTLLINEVETLSPLFNDAPTYTLKDATEMLIYEKGPTSQIIHISAHGVFNEDNPLDSYLALAGDAQNDGNLTVREIYRLNLRDYEPLVVLSACDTAAIDSELNQEDELQSLARAFLIAGADEVIATLWKVPEESTAELLTEFYKNKKGGLDSATSLQLAQEHIRKTWPDPYYWAGFILIGAPN